MKRTTIFADDALIDKGIQRPHQREKMIGMPRLSFLSDFTGRLFVRVAASSISRLIERMEAMRWSGRGSLGINII